MGPKKRPVCSENVLARPDDPKYNSKELPRTYLCGNTFWRRYMFCRRTLDCPLAIKEKASPMNTRRHIPGFASAICGPVIPSCVSVGIGVEQLPCNGQSNSCQGDDKTACVQTECNAL
jgi:hypothetical protein